MKKAKKKKTFPPEGFLNPKIKGVALYSFDKDTKEIKLIKQSWNK